MRVSKWQIFQCRWHSVLRYDIDQYVVPSPPHSSYQTYIKSTGRHGRWTVARWGRTISTIIHLYAGGPAVDYRTINEYARELREEKGDSTPELKWKIQAQIVTLFPSRTPNLTPTYQLPKFLTNRAHFGDWKTPGNLVRLFVESAQNQPNPHLPSVKHSWRISLGGRGVRMTLAEPLAGKQNGAVRSPLCQLLLSTKIGGGHLCH